MIGSGGREHALAWKLARSESVTSVYATPGNPGIAQVATCLPHLDQTPQAWLAAANDLDIDLTVVGPEAPLVAGIVDVFRASGRKIVGPTQANAQLEGSKVFAKRFFAEHSIPTARFRTAVSIEEARGLLSTSDFPIVLKTDGLAAGKGVVVARDSGQAEEALSVLDFPLVIEEFLEGEEVSFIVLSDGMNVVPFEPCQDHKRAFDGDQGPNTGGMGAYCDSRILQAAEREEILNQIIRPTVQATKFTGFLYAGVMMTASGPKLLEYNVRLGDPETQPIMHRVEGDLGQVLLATADSRLNEVKLSWRPEPSVCIVMASEGYPGVVRSGRPIFGIDSAERTGATVFQAGTKVGEAGLETNGGRVLGVTARGENLEWAIQRAYDAVYHIAFAGMHFRHDIGSKGLSRWVDTSYNEEVEGT